MNKLFLLNLIPFVFISCQKDKIIDDTPPTPFSASHGVYISNEGGFQHGNASVSYYNDSTGSAFLDVYKQANNAALGDICQSMQIINGILYLVINNSGKIEICNPNSMIRSTAISGLSSPRYIHQIDSNKAYVTTYSNQISIINLLSNTVSGSIPLNGLMDEMAEINNKIYVTNLLSEYLFVIDPSIDQVIDSIHISKGASSIVEDANGKIWILCGGDYYGTYSAALYQLDPSSGTIQNNLSFPSSDFPSRLCINPSKDTLYYINNNIYRMSINNSQLPANPFIISSGNSFYGLGVNPTANEIYVSDAIDYVQTGKIYRFKANGSLISTFPAGIIPGDFLFF